MDALENPNRKELANSALVGINKRGKSYLNSLTIDEKSGLITNISEPPHYQKKVNDEFVYIMPHKWFLRDVKKGDFVSLQGLMMPMCIVDILPHEVSHIIHFHHGLFHNLIMEGDKNILEESYGELAFVEGVAITVDNNISNIIMEKYPDCGIDLTRVWARKMQLSFGGETECHLLGRRYMILAENLLGKEELLNFWKLKRTPDIKELVNNPLIIENASKFSDKKGYMPIRICSISGGVC